MRLRNTSTLFRRGEADQGAFHVFFRRSLRAKTLLWALVPLASVLVVVAFIAQWAYEQAARDVVQQRDTELARVSAARLSERLAVHGGDLLEIAAKNSVRSMEPSGLGSVLEEASGLLHAFDAGIVAYDDQGSVVWPPLFSDKPPEFLVSAQIDTVRRTFRPAFSNLFQLGESGDDAVMILVPIMGMDNQLSGALAGLANIRTSLLGATLTDVLELKAGRGGFAYLVDSQGGVIYHRDKSQLGKDLSSVLPVTRAIEGKPGAVIAEDEGGKEVVSGFAPVPGMAWAVVTQERWSNVLGPIESRSVWLLLLVAVGGLLSGALIFFAIGRTLRPIKALTRGAQGIAGGDFDYSIAAISGDEIQELAQQFTMMADALKESYTDLEQRVEARTEELRESEERYRELVETAPDVIYTVSTQGEITSLNPSFESITGWSRSEWLGKPFTDLIHPDDLAAATEQFQLVLQGEIPPSFERRVLAKSGDYLTGEFLTVPQWQDGTVIGVFGIGRDVTERKQAEQTLLEQTRELAVLGERNRFAREIHDTLAQGFTGIVLQLEAAEQVLGANAPEVQDHMARAKGLARESLQEARRSVWDLLPQALEQLPLDSAIREEVRRRFNGQGSFSVSGEQRPLSPSVQTALLRICQEALANVSRHAAATRVSVKMAFHPDAVNLEVRDNGIGFDRTGAGGNDEPGGGFGLMGMEQRARQLGGTIVVDSEKGKGTVVEARIPTA